MGIESTSTVKRSSAINSVRYSLESYKEEATVEDSSSFNSALDKLGIDKEESLSPIGYLSEDEFNALYNNVDKLSNEQLEDLLYKFRSSIFVNYNVYDDDSETEFDW